MTQKNFLQKGLVIALLLIAALVLVAPVAAGTVTINPGDSIATAITTAGSGGTVILNPGLYLQSGISVGNAVTIQANTSYGHGPWDTTIDGSNSGTSILTDFSGYALSIDNLTIQNGVSSGSSGGAISSWGSVTVTSSTFTRCSTNGIQGGGAIFSVGSVTVTSSTFTGCSAISSGINGDGGGAISARSVTVTSSIFTVCSVSGGPGGAIYSRDVTVTSSTFTGCSGVNGGAIYSDFGDVTVTSSAFNGCLANGNQGGGAIFSQHSVTVTSSTFTGCSGVNGGAIYAGGVTVTSSTFTGCSASVGGAIYTRSGGTIRFCRIYHNPLATAVYNEGGSLGASDNWWGSNSDPSGNTAGSVTTTSPYLVLGISASPSTVTTGGTSVISANLTYDSTGHLASGGTAPNGTPVTFSSGDGTFSPATAYTEYGVASTTFTPSGTGTAYITATVDSQSVTVPVTVTSGSSTATAIVIDTAAPTNIYAGVDGQGVYRSTNSGGAWNHATVQPVNTHIKALVIKPGTPATLFAGTYGGGVYQSTDSGDHWNTCTNTALANLNVLSLVSDPAGNLYAGTEAGVFTSSDNCTTWTVLNGGLP